MPTEAPAPPLRLAIDYSALADNWRALDRLSGQARAGAAVKANGYGLGARGVTKALAVAGCRDFYVAYAQEAAEIADLVPPHTISVLHGPQDADDAQAIKQAGYRPVINSLSQAAVWLAVGGGECDLMVDTGINRLGLAMTDLGDPLVAQLSVATLLSHLACADEESPLNALQQERWLAASLQVASRETSLANSAGIMLGKDFHGSVTRPGLSLYGGVPRSELAQCIKPVVQPQAVIMQVRYINPGDSIGYNATYTAHAAMRVGVVAVGYADGYLRAWSGKGIMHCGDLTLPVLGRVSMDMTVVDLTHAPQVGEGDWLDMSYDLPSAAETSGLSQYELLTLLGRRFTR